MTTTRDAFEAWAVSKSIDIIKTKDAWGNDIYQHPHVDSMWFGWQAATIADKRQPLTDEQIAVLISDVCDTDDQSLVEFVRDVEAAHGIKAKGAP